MLLTTAEKTIKEDVEKFLEDLKICILSDTCHFMLSNRSKNNNFCKEYLINTKILKDIINNLTCLDFSEVLANIHENYKNEQLYLFAPVLNLTNIYGQNKNLQLYLKINFIKNDETIIVISFHEAEHGLKYEFK